MTFRASLKVLSPGAFRMRLHILLRLVEDGEQLGDILRLGLVDHYPLLLVEELDA